jgi:serine/threonine-protein kinase
MSAQWQKVKEILQSALERSPDERKQFLDKVCGDDESLRHEVGTLFTSLENVGNFMEQPAISAVAEMFVSAENKLQISESLNHYRILSRLGAGGMGEVYLAEDTKLNRFVALKLLPQSLSSDQNANRRLLREAQAASTLDHPHICQIHEIAEADGRSFIVMQFCEGETLAEKLEQKNLNLRETLDLAVQIADALSHAHSHHVIHRDIKPANIIVNNQGQAKILDFGLAKIIAENLNTESEAEATQLLSAANIIIGTPPYMSPEQLRGKPQDARTDIFSFGVVLYEMLSGKQVFKRESLADTISAVFSYEPPIAKTLADTPSELQRIVQKSLAKDKDDRYQTAKDLLIDLQNIKQESDFQNKLEHTAEPRSEMRTQILDVAEITYKEKQSSRAGTTASESKNRKLSFIVSSIVLLFAVVGFDYWFLANRSTNTKQIESIAVMPFVNENGNADNEYLSDGMTETLISSLSQLPKLSVKARSSVFRYKGRDIEPQTVGSELSVQAVLTGRVVQRGDNLLLSIELADTKTGNALWTEQYNRKTTDLVALQSEIARDVSQKLRLRLSGAEERRVAKSYTTNTEAYQLYLKGRFYWNKRTGEGLKKSVEYFNQAIEQDPNYALAFAGLAESYVIFSGFAVSTPQEAYPKAKAAAKKALEIDETLAEAHAALGLELLAYEWNAEESSREFQRAIELNPNYATARHWYGNQNLLYTGHFDEAIAEMKRAQELDPLSLVINTDLGDTYFYARQYDKAIEQLRKTIEMDQSFYYAHYELGMAYEMKGSYAEAIAHYQKARGLNNDPRVLALLGHALAASGKHNEALKTLSELKKTAKQHYVPAYNFAIVYAGLKDRDQAFEWLEKSYQDRSSRMAILKVDPFLDNLRSDPRLTDLIGRVGLMK